MVRRLGPFTARSFGAGWLLDRISVRFRLLATRSFTIDDVSTAPQAAVIKKAGGLIISLEDSEGSFDTYFDQSLIDTFLGWEEDPFDRVRNLEKILFSIAQNGSNAYQSGETPPILALSESVQFDL